MQQQVIRMDLDNLFSRCITDTLFLFEIKNGAGCRI